MYIIKINFSLSSVCIYKATACSSVFLEELVCLEVITASPSPNNVPHIRRQHCALRVGGELVRAASHCACTCYRLDVAEFYQSTNHYHKLQNNRCCRGKKVKFSTLQQYYLQHQRVITYKAYQYVRPSEPIKAVPAAGTGQLQQSAVSLWKNH